MARETTVALRLATFLLMAITYLAVEVACDPRGDLSWLSVAFGLTFFLAALLVQRWTPSPATRQRLPGAWTLVMAVLFVGPLILEPVLRELTGQGRPLELQLVNGLRMVGVGLAALASWPLCLRLAGVVSLFLMLFVSAMGDQPAIPWLLGAYAAIGAVWLMLMYSSRIRQASLAVVEHDTTVVLERARLRFPWREIALFAVLAAVAVSLTMLGPLRDRLTQWELMPTSGGSGAVDLFARFGVGDGPEEVAGENARAAGMVESDKLIEDNQNALVDMISDLYGPPHKPPKDQQRLVAGGFAEIIKFHGKLPENLRPSRDFDTSRKGPKSPKKPESRKARALFEVDGRVPVHVRAMVYGSYDAESARWLEAEKPVSRMIESEDNDWMRVGHLKAFADWYSADERHRLKVADLKTNLVPTPALLTRFRIKRVDRPHYYDWDYDGVVVLPGRKRTPPGVIVHTDCRTLDPARLPATAFVCCAPAGATATTWTEVPEPLRPEIDRLAAEWAGHHEHGWPQIQAVLNKLRTTYTLDETATPPSDHPAPVLWFLTDSRRGPDYLFATAATLLFRSLGHASRMCVGYYAAAEAYDPETEHTPVGPSDLHAWPELLLRDGHWLVVEPTPGYEVLRPRLPWSTRIWLALQTVGGWLASHPFLALACAAAAALAVWQRRVLLDALLVQMWRWFPGRSWRQTVFGCLRVLERRCRWHGCARAAEQTLAAWAAALPHASAANADFHALVRLGEWAAYAPNLPAPLPVHEVRSICYRVLRSWTPHHGRQRTPKASLA
ncbi:MAG: transglutaminase-like domain-containing protein [Gemmataceae bacterium]|nr:transglutaminase-like domain-containing protein [Gemmataceae bacterium]